MSKRVSQFVLSHLYFTKLSQIKKDRKSADWLLEATNAVDLFVVFLQPKLCQLLLWTLSSHKAAKITKSQEVFFPVLLIFSAGNLSWYSRHMLSVRLR